MKTLWNVTTSMMNGTVCMGQCNDLFLTEELAKEAAEKIKEVNKNSDFPVMVNISECKLFESREEVPILNRKENE